MTKRKARSPNPFPYIQRFPSKGKFYAYLWKSRERIEPPHVYGSIGWATAAIAAEKAWQDKQSVIATWGTAVAQYKASSDFTDLMPRSKRDYENVLEYLDGMSPYALTIFDRPRIEKIKEKARVDRKRHIANYCVIVLSVVFNSARKFGLFNGANPVTGTKKFKKPKSEPEANVGWTQNEIDTYRDFAAERHSVMQAPFALGVYTGMREGDVCDLLKTDYVGDEIRVKTNKTGMFMVYPVLEALRVYLDAIPPNDSPYLFVNTKGRQWTGTGFRQSFFDLRDRLAERGLVRKELTFHGLRTTLAQRAAHLGYSDDQIADLLGHKGTAATKIYVGDAARGKNVKRMVADVAENSSATGLYNDLYNSERVTRKAVRKSLK